MTFERYDANRPLTGELREQSLALLETSFPEEERRETPVQRRMLDGGEIGALAARNEDGTLAAVLTMWPMTDALFLEHFAVNPALRSQGLGGRILEELKKQTDCPLVLEAELPETDWARRRLGFYARHGWVAEEDLPYFQPSYRAGGKDLPLRLLSCPAFASREQAERTAREIHRTVYKMTR